MTKLEQAFAFLQQGIAVIPLQHRGKKPETSLIGGMWEQYTTILSTELEVTNWLFSTWQNYGVVAGWNNLVIIDFDEIEYFKIWQAWANSFISDVIERAFKVITSRGIHVYVTTEKTVTNDKRIKAKGGIDVQAWHKFVVGPGSIHPNGTQYVGVGQMDFPMVQDIESILPLDLFPRVAHEAERGAMPIVNLVPNNTEYQDLLAIASGANGYDLISKVKSAVRIENLFTNVQRTSIDGRWLATICPFHDDHNPSMWIDTRRQLCGCQVCGMKAMDAINLYSRMHNISESVAVSQMAKEVGVWG